MDYLQSFTKEKDMRNAFYVVAFKKKKNIIRKL